MLDARCSMLKATRWSIIAMDCQRASGKCAAVGAAYGLPWEEIAVARQAKVSVTYAPGCERDDPDAAVAWRGHGLTRAPCPQQLILPRDCQDATLDCEGSWGAFRHGAFLRHVVDIPPSRDTSTAGGHSPLPGRGTRNVLYITFLCVRHVPSRRAIPGSSCVPFGRALLRPRARSGKGELRSGWNAIDLRA